MTRIETEAKIAELEEELLEAQDELKARPTNTIEVEVIKEVTIENSSTGGDIGALGKALADAQSEFKAVGKNKDGHGYRFSNFQSIVEHSTPILSKNGLSISQLGVTKMLGKTLLTGVKTILIHESGGYISSESYIPTMKTKMNSLVQVYGVNSSYQKRYNWLAICGLSTTDDKTDTDGVA